jgi:hypothetical protein
MAYRPILPFALAANCLIWTSGFICPDNKEEWTREYAQFAILCRKMYVRFLSSLFAKTNISFFSNRIEITVQVLKAVDYFQNFL